MRELARNTSPFEAILPATLTATPTAITVDLLGFDSCLFILRVGAGGITFDNTNRVDFRLQHSTDNSTYTNVGPNDVVGAPIAAPSAANGFVRSLITAKAAIDTVDFAYVGGNRYVQLVPVFGGTHGAGTQMYAQALRGNPHVAPIA
jgi:hypothetical protein